MWLDTQHNVITSDVMYTGTVDQSRVYPREIIRRAIERNAASVVFAHNHPSGNLQPSTADELITRRLKEALALIEVRVLDSMVVTRDGVFSLAEHGLM